MFKRELSNNGAGLHIELGFLLLTLLLSGCITTTQEKLDFYDCYWGCINEEGKTGWCCRKQVPITDRDIFNCENAKDRVVR